MKFSVLISVYQAEQPGWLANALDSISVAQQLAPDQIVLVEDGPLTAELAAVIESFAANSPVPFQRVSLPVNKGLGAALHSGLAACDYDWVARMDADDIAAPERFLTQIAFLNANPAVDVVGSYALDINEFGDELGVRKVPLTSDDIFKLMWACPVIHPSVMFRKSAVLKAGSYSVTLKRRQDYDLWFRCAAQGVKFANIATPLIQYRITNQTYVRNSFRVAWNQAMIGLKGCWRLSLGLKAYLGVFYPVLKAALPIGLRKSLENIVKKFDPRGRA